MRNIFRKLIYMFYFYFPHEDRKALGLDYFSASRCLRVHRRFAPQPVQVTTRSSSQLPLAQPISNWPTSTTATTPLIEWRQTSSANCPAGHRSSVGDGHGVSSPPAAATSARQEPSLSLPCAGSTHRAPWRRRHFTSGMLRVGESTGFS